MPKKTNFVMTANGQRFQVRLPEYYEKVDNLLGLVKATDADSGLSRKTVASLLLDGLGVKVKTSRKVGRKYYFTEFVCSVNNLTSALNQLEGKSFGTTANSTGEIISAYFGRRRRLG